MYAAVDCFVKFLAVFLKIQDEPSPYQTKFACAKLPNKEKNAAHILLSFLKTKPGVGSTGLCRF